MVLGSGGLLVVRYKRGKARWALHNYGPSISSSMMMPVMLKREIRRRKPSSCHQRIPTSENLEVRRRRRRQELRQRIRPPTMMPITKQTRVRAHDTFCITALRFVGRLIPYVRLIFHFSFVSHKAWTFTDDGLVFFFVLSFCFRTPS